MTVLKCREVIDKIKDELRNQTSLWNYQLTRDRAMNLALQRKVESAIEKSKILQKIRIKHAEKLLDDIEFGNPYKQDLENEIRTYWTAILPDIKDTLRRFQEINSLRKFQDQIHTLELPEELDIDVLIEPDPEPDIKSHCSELTRNSAITVSGILGNTHRPQTRRSKSRNRFNR